ncbi:MAG: cobalamin-binding protein [Euryarchaeota archaeon]|nr:cobalamin-binding protein [Euryarchaeota archaeon]
MFTRYYLMMFVLLVAVTGNASAIVSEPVEYPLTITDNFNYTVIIDEKPQRIVSTMKSNTELLFAVGAGDDVVGGTMHDDYPPEVENLTRVGGYTNLNYESIVDLEPDLVLAEEGNGEEAVNMMKDLGLNVVVLNAYTIDDIMENIELVGRITDNENNALAITADMRQRIGNVNQMTDGLPDEVRPRVLYIVWDDPMYGAGADTYPSDLVHMAGGVNIVKVDGWPVISLEDTIASNPQIIICSSMGNRSYTIMESINNNEVLAQTDAVKNNRVYAIANPGTIEISGPRIVQGLEELYTYILPVTTENQLVTEGTEDESDDTASVPGFGMLLATITLLAGYLRIRK